MLNYASSHLQVAARKFLHCCDERNGMVRSGYGNRSLLQYVYPGGLDGDRGLARSWACSTPGGCVAARGSALSLDVDFPDIEFPLGVHHVRGLRNGLLSQRHFL